MDADQLLSLLGRNADDPLIEDVFIALRTRRRPELDPADGDSLTDFVLVRRQGVEFGFIDKAFFEAEPLSQRRRKDVPLILHQLYFYSEIGDISAFAGKLPLGLEWSDTPATARARLAQYEDTRRSYIKDAWTLPQFHLIVEYKEMRDGLLSILCQLPMRPWPEKGRLQPAIKVDEWLALFGHKLTSAALVKALRPLDLVRILEENDDIHELDLRRECGLELGFTQAKNLTRDLPAPARKKDLVLGAATFYRSREADARQWSGELPAGLSFEDTPLSIVEKIGREPDERHDDRLLGSALWHLDHYNIHVQYSTVENHLTQISLMAPGYMD